MEELKSEIISEIWLPTFVGSTSEVAHVNVIKKEFFVFEPNSCDELEEHAIGSMNLKLKSEKEQDVKPELTNEISFPTVVNSTFDSAHLNVFKEEFSPSEPHSYGCDENTVEKMNYEQEQARLDQLLNEVGSASESFDDDSENEEDLVEEQNLGTDTEDAPSGDEQPLNPPKKPKISSFIAKDGTIWKKSFQNLKTPQLNTVIELPGVKPFGKQAKTALDCWNLFFSDEIFNIIVENTNLYIVTYSKKFSRERSARRTDIIELKAVLGLLYLAGCLKNSRLSTNEIWDRKGMGVERFWLTMTKERFMFLLNCLRFDNLYTRDERRSTDNLAPIRQLFEIFVENCNKCYSISEYGTIDEKLEAFRGKCVFKQHMPNKPAKYGLKMFVLVDAKTRYTLNLELYAGQQPEGPYYLKSDSVSIVTRLITPISGTGRNITCNSWFTSFSLIKTLLQEHSLTCMGTVSKNKRQLPLEFTKTEQRPVGSSMFGFKENLAIVSFIPNKGKNVILASSMRHNDAIDASAGEKSIPEMITFYNSTKSGVEAVDQLAAAYDVKRNTRRWSMAVFYSLLNIAGINSQIVYFSNNTDKSSNVVRRKYLKNLALALTEEHIKRRATLTNISPEIRQRRQEVAGTSSEFNTADRFLPGTRKRCYYCKNDSKTRYYCTICKKFICLSHAEFLCSDCKPLP